MSPQLHVGTRVISYVMHLFLIILIWLGKNTAPLLCLPDTFCLELQYSSFHQSFQYFGQDPGNQVLKVEPKAECRQTEAEEN